MLTPHISSIYLVDSLLGPSIFTEKKTFFSGSHELLFSHRLLMRTQTSQALSQLDIEHDCLMQRPYKQPQVQLREQEFLTCKQKVLRNFSHAISREVEGHCNQLMHENSQLNVLQLFRIFYFLNTNKTFSHGFAW